DPPCLGQRLFDYLEAHALLQAYQSLQEQNDSDGALTFSCVLRGSGRRLQARMRLLGQRLSSAEQRPSGYLLTLDTDTQPEAHRHVFQKNSGVSRCLAYDFELLSRGRHTDMALLPLDALTYVVFDTETTGLLPGRGDQIVQLAAVRIVN